MLKNLISARIAAAALAAALAFGGLAGLGAAALDDHPTDAPTEETAAGALGSGSFRVEKFGATWS